MVRDIRYGIAPGMYTEGTNKQKYCGQLSLLVRYGTGQIRDSARRDTNKQTNTKLKLCGPWLAPDVTEVTSSA